MCGFVSLCEALHTFRTFADAVAPAGLLPSYLATPSRNNSRIDAREFTAVAKPWHYGNSAEINQDLRNLFQISFNA